MYSILCVITNIKEDINLFSKGTKVYVMPCAWDTSWGRYEVVGICRKSRKFILAIIDKKYFNNTRTKIIYSPSMIKRLEEKLEYRFWTKEKANLFIKYLQK